MNPSLLEVLRFGHRLDWTLFVWIPLSWLLKLFLPDPIGVGLAVFVAVLLSYRLPEVCERFALHLWIVRCGVIAIGASLLWFFYLKLLGR